MRMDETLHRIAERCKNFAVFFLVDTTQVGRRAPDRNIRLIVSDSSFPEQVPDFNKMYELYDPCTVMFFYRNKHIMIDLGTGNNNKSICLEHYFCFVFSLIFSFEFAWPLTVNWPIDDPQEMIDIVETVYRGSRKGRGLVVAPKDYSTKYKY